MAWIALLITFTILEVKAINRMDKQNETVRDAQNRAFEGIAGDLKTSMETSKQNYETTIGQVKDVLQQAKDISSLTKENLRNITGGTSFAFLLPQDFEESTHYAMALYNGGGEILTGVSVSVSKILEKGCLPFDSGKLKPCRMDGGLMNPTPVPILAAHGSYEMPLFLNLPSDETDVLFVLIQAQNGNAEELIWFRKAKSGMDGHIELRFEQV